MRNQLKMENKLIPLPLEESLVESLYEAFYN